MTSDGALAIGTTLTGGSSTDSGAGGVVGGEVMGLVRRTYSSLVIKYSVSFGQY